MIDPHNVTNFERTDRELQEWWLFSTIVAGKTAEVQARALESFLVDLPGGGFPFDKVLSAHLAGDLRVHMERARLGQYSRLEHCFVQSVTHLDLRNDPVAKFEAIHGVGPKTARMFLMHSRRDQRLAALDTHILAHLAQHGVEVPKATPGSAREYLRLEQEFLKLADAAGMSPADYDLMIWSSRARSIKEAA